MDSAPKFQAQIIVTLLMDGSIQVIAPLDNKILCYGLLEVARDQIAAHKPSGILTAGG